MLALFTALESPAACSGDEIAVPFSLPAGRQGRLSNGVNPISHNILLH
jgi:hypothetical protein